MQGVRMSNDIKENIKFSISYKEIKENLTQQTIWLRGLYMLMFALFYSIAELVLFAVVVFQFLFNLFTGKSNPRLLELGQSLATYIYQIIQRPKFAD